MQGSFFNRVLYELFRCPFALGFVSGFGIRYYGQTNIPREGGFLLVSNHQSHLDPPAVGAGVWRQMNFVARKTLFDNRVFGWIIRNIRALPIDRDGLGLGGLKEALRRLKSGEPMVLFPEGTRSPTGEIQPFLPGFTALAIRGKVPVVPAAIDGAFDAWPKGRSFPIFGHKIRVMYGEPISVNEVKALGDRELVAETERRVRECLARLRAMRPNGRP